MEIPYLRAGRLGTWQGKFDQRPVPEFQEEVNAGTLSERVSTEDHPEGRDRKMAISLAKKMRGRHHTRAQEDHRSR
jgi:hypothetical protein